MGTTIDRQAGKDVTLYLDVATVQDGMIDQPAGFPTIRISHSIDGVNIVEDLAETVMNKDGSRTGEFLYEWKTPGDAQGRQYKVQYKAKIGNQFFYDFDIINVPGVQECNTPTVKFK